MDQIVFAKWDNTKLWYLAEVISITNGRYNVYFMDGYSKQDLPESDIRVVPERQRKRHSQVIGKTFYDPGDKDGRFKPGMFTVLCYQPGSGGKTGNYWCERNTTDVVDEKRDIIEFDCKEVKRLLEKTGSIDE